MNSKSMRVLVAVATAAALALPATAAAKSHGAGKGRGADRAHSAHGHEQKGRALNVKGTVTAVGDGTIDVLVAGANHHGRALRGQTVTVDVSSARIVVHDVNGDGARDLADVAVGDRVVVQSRIAKGATPDPAQPLVAQRVVDKGAKRVHTEPDGTGDEPPADGSETPPTP